MLEFDSKLYFRVAYLAFLIPLGSGVCIDLDLGLENERISDGNITASSVQNANTPAKNGRLNYTSGSSWCAGTSDTNPYLQIDLQTLHIICAVSTQGNSLADQWVKTYTLQLSINGSTWTDYKEAGQVKVFMGNGDRNSVVKHVVYGLLTRYVRFLPQTYQGLVCLRTEVFGVKQKPENLALGKATTQSSTFNITADNVYGVSGNAVDGNPNTNFLKGSCSHTQNNNLSWWRVDLGSDYVDVSEVHIVNRFSQHVVTEDYKITFGGFDNVLLNSPCGGLYDFHNFTASAVCFTNPLKTGRYIGILTTKKQSLELCEVEVYSRENLAFQKPTYQHLKTLVNGTSDRAVDGNSNMNFAGESCSFVQDNPFPWWRVDLGQDEFVTEVYVVGLHDVHRLTKFEIKVGRLIHLQ
ncbi:neuropilin-1-like isoform X2 [Pocillopora damicornis]|uniref:neuropilin-1-like isoform X2 n=1 Tax=Pocillopora damicornis TaxID=46731 RepID=UPI000F553BB5|nr:neuropilin-1-like isoform X2 [Pocillopora damicornis]